jgi:hypothetical protein
LRQYVVIEDLSFYHDADGNLYELYLSQPFKVETFEFSNGKLLINAEMRIDGYTGRIIGRYSCAICFDEEKLIIQDQYFDYSIN